MPDIWGSRDANIALILQRARWCWRHLRCEQVKGSVLAPHDERARRNIRYLSIFQLVMVIAVDDWDAPIAERTARRSEYLNWVFQEVVKPMAAVEEGLEAWLLDQMAASFKNMLARKAASGDETEAKVLRWLVGALIDGFPEPWRERLVGKALGSQTENIVTIGPEVMFLGRDFARGVTEVMKSGVAEIKQVGSDAMARLVKSAGAMAITLEVGSERLELADASFGLMSGKPELRRGAAAELARELDLPGHERAGFAARVLALGDAEACMAEVAAARKGSFAAQLSALAEAMGSNKGVDYALLSPPAPAILAQYLRFDLSAGTAGCLEGVGHLIEEVGVLQAGKRLAGTTLRMPTRCKHECSALDPVRYSQLLQ